MFPDLTRDDVFRLETARLWLRWPRQGDARAVQDLAAAKEVADMMKKLPRAYPHEGADGFILSTRHANMEGTGLTLAIAPKARPTVPIGVIGVFPTQVATESELAFWIGRPYWGEGFMTEAVAAMRDAAFRFADSQVLTARAALDNPASRRVLAKCGFEPVAMSDGSRHGADTFRMTREQWREEAEVQREKPLRASQSLLRDLTARAGTENDLPQAAE